MTDTVLPGGLYAMKNGKPELIERTKAAGQETSQKTPKKTAKKSKAAGAD